MNNIQLRTTHWYTINNIQFNLCTFCMKQTHVIYSTDTRYKKKMVRSVAMDVGPSSHQSSDMVFNYFYFKFERNDKS